MTRHGGWSAFVARRGPLACALSLVLAITACSATQTVQPAPTSTVLLGMGGGAIFMHLPDPELARELNAVKDSGAKWLRIDVDWSDIEAKRGQQDWTNTDRVVEAARSRGLLVLGIIAYTPVWARDATVSGDTTHGRPASPDLFATFAAQAAARYARQVTSWEVWNEPNVRQFFMPRPDPDFYTRMLQASYRAIHAVAPTATVVGGSMAPATDEPDGSAVAPTSFLERIYAAGAKESMDALSIHPYSFPANPSDSTTAAWNTFYRLRYIRDTMKRYGDENKTLWLTEFGAPTTTVQTGGGSGMVSEQRQAEIIGDGLRFASKFYPLGPVFIYSIRDQQTGGADPELNFGLLRTDFSPKPAYAVVMQYAGAH